MRYFAVIREPGPAWNHGRAMAEQDEWAAHAAFMTQNCLAGKLKAWGKLRQCQRNEEAKSVRGRASDVVKCQSSRKVC